MQTWTKVVLGAVVVGGGVAAYGAWKKGRAEASPASSASSAPSASASASPSSSTRTAPNGMELGNKKNVTDDIAPAPADVNDPAPPGSHIVGWKTPDGALPETNRILNLRERWKRIAMWGQLDPKTGSFKRLMPDEILKYQAWTIFGNTSAGRMLRSMNGWEQQFLSLESVEDTVKRRDPSFVIDRRDVTLLPHTPGT